MACRDLPCRRRVWGMAIGAGVAVLLRIVFVAAIAPRLLPLYLKIVGGLALLYIAAKLLPPTSRPRARPKRPSISDARSAASPSPAWS